MIALALCIVAGIHDGDTIRCTDHTRLRLAGIDAPEIQCQRNRPLCVTAGAIEARDNLRRMAPLGSELRFEVVDASLCKAGFQATDPYGRPVVRAYIRGIDLGAAQLRGGFARPWRCKQ